MIRHPDPAVILTGTPGSIEELPYELVERKGVGHPDTMCDAIAERMSRYYSQYCLEHFGGIAHHWFDKVTLYGGSADVSYGHGELRSPYRVAVFGKGAYRVGSEEIPVQEIMFRAAVDVLREVTTGFDPARHLALEVKIVDHQGAGRGASRYQPQSARDLVPLRAVGLVSNDTNLVHGYAPLSRLEHTVLGVERLINGPDFKARNPDTGWDVKVFGSRRANRFSIIANMPFLAGRIESLEQYWSRKAEVQAEVATWIRGFIGDEFELLMNATDRNGRGYLTALGSVADTGDVGVVGRGNRVNGLITPMRPMSIEAPAGKNPLDHTGKIYNVMATRLASRIAAEMGGPVHVHIFASKEAPLECPDEVAVASEHGASPQVADLVRQAVANCGSITAEFVEKGIVLW